MMISENQLSSSAEQKLTMSLFPLNKVLEGLWPQRHETHQASLITLLQQRLRLWLAVWLACWLACSCSRSSAVFFYDFWGMGNRTSECMEDDSLLFCYQAQRLGYIIIKDLHSLVLVVCTHIGGLSKNGALIVKNWEEGRTWLPSPTTLHQIVWSFCWENLGNMQIFFPSNLQSCFLPPFFTQILLSLYKIFPLGFPEEAIQRTAIALVLDFSLVSVSSVT